MGEVGGNARVAFGDESVRFVANPPIYLMAATVLNDEEGMARLESMKPRGAGKLHWREMTDKLKRKSLEIISSFNHASLIVAAAPLPRKKQERARRKCLESMLVELERRGIELVILESRTPDKNAKDVDLLISMRSKKAVSVIDVAHLRGEDEPRLWVPDQILGAYGDALCKSRGFDKWRQEWEVVAQKVTVLDIRL